jgi:hypothetical protein
MLAKSLQRGLSARTLMSPRVSRWLAETANVNTARQAQDQVRRLGTIMAREPALTAELQPLQKWLNEVITSPAASETGGGQNEQ